MVLGLKTNSRKSATVQVNYLIQVQEIKPWPPSQSLKTLRSVLLQWENGDRCSGSTSSVVPSLGSGVGDGKIEFNESFRLPVTLSRDMSIKGGNVDAFQKNCLEFNLYEPRRDKTVKGQLLGTAIIDLADYGVVKETLSISASVNCKRSFRNTAQPVLFIKIHPFDKNRTNSLSRDSLSKEVLLDKNGGESVSTLMSEEYAEEAEIALFTDDDISSHSSRTVSSSAYESNGRILHQNEENGSETVKDSTEGAIREHEVPSKLEAVKSDMVAPHDNQKQSSSCSSSIDLSSGPESPVNGHKSLSSVSECSMKSVSEQIIAPSVQSSSSSSSVAYEIIEESDCSMRITDHGNLAQEVNAKEPSCGSDIRGNVEHSTKKTISNGFSAKLASPNANAQAGEKLGYIDCIGSQVDGHAWKSIRNGLVGAAAVDDNYNSPIKDKDGNKQQENSNEAQILGEKKHSTEAEAIYRFSQDANGIQVLSGSNTLSHSRFISTSDRLRHVKSVRSPSDCTRGNGLVNSNQFMVEVNEAVVLGDAQNGERIFLNNERKDVKVFPKEKKSIVRDSKIQSLEYRINMLEGELREAAAIEASLYSVIAEHGSSISKVHAPARRLFRLYIHACKESALSRRASAARTAVSGLVLVAKACGNDVPRLTYWLSNSVVLRATIAQIIGKSELPLSAGSSTERNGSGRADNTRSSSLKWKESSLNAKERKKALHETFGDWENPHVFTSALEKIEAWIFSRIIESIWWQALTPHMQSAAAKVTDRGTVPGSKKNYERTYSSGDQEQVNFSVDLWKKAFKDVCERLCPVRAGGHECGCLPMLTRLITEQCVARLDVAMFNAILRESADEIPTDPVSDPICDPMVLPIPVGISSFGAGAQLKNAIGNWSRWLTDLFGMDNDSNDYNDYDDERSVVTFKSFHLLNTLSDLMMLPKDLVLSRSIRKEVCPTFGAPLIKRVVDSFVPDEFCPDPVPEVVLEALDSEDTFEEVGDEVVRNLPFISPRINYSPPSAALVAGIIGEIGSPQLRRSGSSVLRKSYISDDELDELDSPLTSIILDGFRASPTSSKPNLKLKENGSRYQLLREVWMNSV